jgi:SPP1 family predicted phage head-tail adaptor
VSAPRFGAFGDRVQLQRREMTGEDEGGHAVLFVPIMLLWARVTAVGAHQVQLADGRAVSMSHTVVIRHRTGVRPGDRFVYRGRKLDVLSAEDISGRRQYLACRCAEAAVSG